MNGVLGDEKGILCHHGMIFGCEVCCMLHIPGCECDYCYQKNHRPLVLKEGNILDNFCYGKEAHKKNE